MNRKSKIGRFIEHKEKQNRKEKKQILSRPNDDASLSLVPSGMYMVELSKFFCKINWLLLSIYTLYYY